MLEALFSDVQTLLGLNLDVSDVKAPQMALRTVVIYVFTLAVVRLGSRRFFGNSAALDVIVGIMLGSVMSRAINGSAPFVPTLAAGAMLIAIHWLLAVLAFHFHWLGPFVKGSAIVLIERGQVREEGMRRAGITRRDLTEALRHSQQTDVSKVESAHLERDGQISILPIKGEPRVVEVSVADGVQTIRVELA